MDPILSIRGLRKQYDDGFEALKGVTLDIKAGGFTCLCLAIIWWIFKTGWRIRN